MDELIKANKNTISSGKKMVSRKSLSKFFFMCNLASLILSKGNSPFKCVISDIWFQLYKVIVEIIKIVESILNIMRMQNYMCILYQTNRGFWVIFKHWKQKVSHRHFSTEIRRPKINPKIQFKPDCKRLRRHMKRYSFEK